MRARISSTRTDPRLLRPGLLGPKGKEAFKDALSIAGAALLGAAMVLLVVLLHGCASARPPVAIVAPCPQIPMPAEPAAPRVVLPEPDAQGRYCLTQGQVDELARGIRELQAFAKKVVAAVNVYNEEQERQPRTAPGAP